MKTSNQAITDLLSSEIFLLRSDDTDEHHDFGSWSYEIVCSQSVVLDHYSVGRDSCTVPSNECVTVLILHIPERSHLHFPYLPHFF